MNINKFIILLLLLSVAVTQQPFDSSPDLTPEYPRQSQSFSFSQQCPLQDADAQGMQSMENGIGDIITSLLRKASQITSNEWQEFSSMMPWIYIIYNIGCAFLLSQQYCYENLSFSYTIISLVKQIHFGVLYYLYCSIFQGSQTKGLIIFAIIIIINSWKIISVLLSGKPQKKQVAMTVACYFFLTYMALCWREYFEISLQLIYTYIHYDYIFSEDVKIHFHQLTINFFINNLLIIISTWPPYILISHITFLQMQAFIYFTLFMLTLRPPLIRKLLAKDLRRFYHNFILRKLGKKPQTDICAICWQQMEIYAGFYEIEDFKQAFGSNIVRVHKNHFFHASCLFMWSLEKSTCPLDNQEIDLY